MVCLIITIVLLVITFLPIILLCGTTGWAVWILIGIIVGGCLSKKFEIRRKDKD